MFGQPVCFDYNKQVLTVQQEQMTTTLHYKAETSLPFRADYW